MIKINLLIVEDDSTQNDTYQMSIEEYNKDHENVKIVPTFAKNLQEGLDAIKRQNFEAAIVDIRLSNDDIDGSGNKILWEIKDNLRFPVRVVTGYKGDIDSDLQKENVFWKIFSKTDEKVETILDELVFICKTGILRILGYKGKIEKYLSKIFWEHLSEHFDEFKPYSEIPDFEKILLRYISIYLLEYMDIDNEGVDKTYIPPEFYLKPSVRSELFTGTLITNKNTKEMYVILTPACDMVLRTAKDGQQKFRNAEKFLSAQLIPLDKLTHVNRKGEYKTFKDLIKDRNGQNTLKGYMKNRKERYHFLPPYKDIPASFIDFQSISSFTEDEIKQNFQQIASISKIFLRDIIARFSRYYARQGQPNLDIEKIFLDIQS